MMRSAFWVTLLVTVYLAYLSTTPGSQVAATPVAAEGSVAIQGGAANEDDDIETKLGKKLQKRLDEVLEKIKDAIDDGKTVKEETLAKVKQIESMLKDMKLDIEQKSKELLEQIKEKAKDYWKKILDKLTGRD